MKSYRPYLILFVITLAAYWNTFHAPFVFDDLATIQRNTSVRFGTVDPWAVLGARSILYLSFLLNFKLSGMDTFSYHAVNFVIHFLNGSLLFILARHIFKNATYALFAAALFLVHPIQTESVTYISSRSELLSTFFYLAGFLTYVLWPYRRGVLCALLVAVPFVLGIGSKETAITLPASILLYDWLLERRFNWRFFLMYAIAGCTAGYFILIQVRNSIGAREGQLGSYDYLLTQFHVLWTYIRLIFLPIGQNLDYDYPYARSILEPATLFSFLGLMGLLALGWIVRHKWTVLAFSIFWFFITLAPTSSVISIADVIFEHRLYLPMVGVSLSFPLLLQVFRGRSHNR